MVVLARLNIGLIVTSDRIYERIGKDENLKTLNEHLRGAEGVELAFYYTVPNDPHMIRAITDEASRVCDLVIVTGGTGVSPRDKTVESLASIASREVRSLGDLLRLKSSREIGDKAFISRSTAFIVRGALVVVIPGNPSALKVLLHMMESILEHVAEEIRGSLHHGKHIA